LPVPLHNFPFEAVAKPLKQMPIVQTHHRLAGLQIERDPAPLRSRILHDFNSAHRNDSCDSAGGRLEQNENKKSSHAPLFHYHRRMEPAQQQDVVEGSIRIFLQDPKEKVEPTPGQSFAVPPKRPHLVTNAGDNSAVFLVLQGVGEYDFVPLT
jgi:hypothetical protein